MNCKLLYSRAVLSLFHPDQRFKVYQVITILSCISRVTLVRSFFWVWVTKQMYSFPPNSQFSLQWRHNEHDCVSDYQPRDCLLNRLIRRRSKKISKLRVTGLCVGNSPVTGEFRAQKASNAENVSIWWRHHVLISNTAVVHWTSHPYLTGVTKVTAAAKYDVFHHIWHNQTCL